MDNLFIGTGVALVTPFRKDFSIDYEALAHLVNLQINGGTDFLVVQGTTGESPTLTEDEKRTVLECVQEVNKKRLKIVFGVGGNNTHRTGEQLRRLPSGIDGVLSVSPYYNKPTQKGIVAHYKYLASCTDLPIILYNVPGRTGSNMTAETTLELSEIANIVAIKEASGNMEQIMEIIRCRPQGFGVLSGDDALTLPMISLGAEGVISVVANAFPERFSKMVKLALKERFTEAREEHYHILKMIAFCFEEGNPGGIKAALKCRNVMQEYLRLPLVEISEHLRLRIQEETKRLLN
jgi:4-hydroxy-tetrahydrodipicolinate synthase